MREDFWNELNESRELLVPKMWKGVFPEADNINFHTLVEINQYKASVSNNDQLLKGTAHIPGVEFDARIKPFYLEFVEKYKRVDTETIWNASLFFSLSDAHHSVHVEETPAAVEQEAPAEEAAPEEDATKKEE